MYIVELTGCGYNFGVLACCQDEEIGGEDLGSVEHCKSAHFAHQVVGQQFGSGGGDSLCVGRC